MSAQVRMHEDERPVDEELVRRLLAEQHPQLAHLPLGRVEPWGTDNAIWRLGTELAVRLPRIEWAVEQIGFEAEWLPWLAPHLDVAIPLTAAEGAPGAGYRWPWSVVQWVPGSAADSAVSESRDFALDLARLVRSLQRIESAGARPARNRALPLEDYDEDARETIEGARGLVDTDAALAVWEEALAALPYDGPPVWVHGDLEGNCIVAGERLNGVVDWGSACVGDPAVDVQVVWSPLFAARTRELFLSELEVDDATLARSRGAAVQQACAALPYYLETYPLIVERSVHKLRELGVAVRATPSGG